MAFNFGGVGEDAKGGKPCRACSDFQTWAKQRQQHTMSNKKSESAPRNSQCPLDKDELGNMTWGFLHTMAAYYPDQPTPQQQHSMKLFFNTFSQFYPCHVCAQDLQKELKVKPPAVESQKKLSQWLCEIHNNVNVKLGKSVFDCNRVNERWKDGWLDGSCD